MSLEKKIIKRKKYSGNVINLPSSRKQILCEKLQKIFNVDANHIYDVVEKIRIRHKMRK